VDGLVSIAVDGSSDTGRPLPQRAGSDQVEPAMTTTPVTRSLASHTMRRAMKPPLE
jgi:hypothetical protein